MEFVGRHRELTVLRREWERISAGTARPTRGTCLLVRGRRRVGKSRLVEEFLDRSGAPHVYFTASRQGARELDVFVDDVVTSTLPSRELLASARFATWESALRALANAIGDQPAVVVIDELPYRTADEPSLEAVLQRVWDRWLSKTPVLLVLIGSDLARMEALSGHGRAFYQRGRELVVGPLTPPEAAQIVGIDDPADAFDAYLVTGGLPLVAAEWSPGATLWDFLEAELHDPTSALIVSGERSLAAEFPTEAQARAVLTQIGAGERTFANVARAAGGLQASSLTRSLGVLLDKRIVARDLPLSAKPSREARYRVADPSLRFWLAFVGPHVDEIERGRGDRVLARVRAGWDAWRGRAIEPMVREAVARLQPFDTVTDARAVGGWWTRTNVPEIDLVGIDRPAAPGAVCFVGSIKWRNDQPFDQADLAQLFAVSAAVPGASAATPVVVASRSPVTARGVTIALEPADLLQAWPLE